jgi:hypothetical protein
MLMLVLAPVARAEVTTNQTVSYTFNQYISCLNGGAGDEVSLSGTEHIVTSSTVDRNGGVHTTHHVNRYISGSGTSGAEYVGVGIPNVIVTNTRGPFPYETTYVETASIIGKGSADSFLVHVLVHLTIDAKGNTTADVFAFNADCH